MQISATIMAVPKRKENAERLFWELLNYPFVDVSITYDQVADGAHSSEWENGKNSMLAGIGKGEFHVVIQDDAILTPNLYENIEGAILNSPTKTLISLYTGTSRPLGKRVSHAVEKAQDGDFLNYWLLMWGVGLVIPTDHIEPMLEFVADREEPYDTRIGIFYQRNMMPIYYTIPSLVDHDDRGGSLLGHGILPGERVAHRPATGKVTYTGNIINI